MKQNLLNNQEAARISTHERVSFGQMEFEAELYQEVGTSDELVKSIIAARECGIPFHILGGGYVPEDGQQEVEGLVIKNNSRKFAILSMRGKINAGEKAQEQAFVTAESGVGLNQLVRFTIDEGLGGLESYLGESGTLGDGITRHLQYEKENDFLVSHVFTLRILTKENEIIEVNAEPFLHPFTMNMIAKKQVIPLSVVFHLTPTDKSELWKKGTQAAFERNQTDLLDPLKGNFSY